MRIVVTGLSGNLGTALLRRLTVTTGGAPEHQVAGVCRRPPGAGEPYERAEWTALDLGAPDADRALLPVVRGADAVVHLAWLFQPSHATGYLERVDVGGTAAVLRACTEAQVPHLVHMSSLGVYSPGPDQVPGLRVDEGWPRDGIPSHAYSRHKVWAERLLDAHPGDRAPALARLRPALILQRSAASAILRYALPGWLPAGAVRLLPVLPLDRHLVVQGVHADDVADAVVRVLHLRATGAFNLAAEPPVTRDDIAEALGARAVHLPAGALRRLLALSWRARLQPLDPGWLDLAVTTPLMDSGRAARELGWHPAVDARQALRELIDGMADAAGEPGSPVLRPRSVADQAAEATRHGPVASRPLP